MLVHTSGSTGKPKPMWVEKKRMAHSARTTCAFLGLKRGDTALLCLSLNYIAGKMMAVRAIEWGLNLVCVEPSGHPLSTINVELSSQELKGVKGSQKPLASGANNLSSESPSLREGLGVGSSSTCQLVNSSTKSSNLSTCQLVNSSTKITFAAMTPMQVYNTLQVAEERERLMQIKHLIIGGGAIDEALEAELRHFPNAVWSTYGMTETLSHIALRRINRASPCPSEGKASPPALSLERELKTSPNTTTLFRSEGVKEWRSVDVCLASKSVPPFSKGRLGGDCESFNAPRSTLNVKCPSPSVSPFPRGSIVCLASNPSSPNSHPSSNLSSSGVHPTPPPSEGSGEVSIPPSFGGDGGGYYTPFPDVSVSLNGEGCLVIDAPGVCAQRLVTNDCAELHPDGRRFRIIGRKDNVINSGGIKIHAEEVEQMLRPHLGMPFIITKATDPKFGEVVALVYEEGSCGESIQSICQSVLPKYWQPRRYLPVEQILLTETGKPRRDISLYL